MEIHKLKILQKLRLLLEKDLKTFVDNQQSFSQYKEGSEAYERFLKQTLNKITNKSRNEEPKEFPDGWKSKPIPVQQ